jgi:hypothetical protein
MSLKRGLLSTGLLAGAVAFGVLSSDSAQAASLTLGSSGWSASWAPAFENGAGTHVTLTVLAETENAVVLQKVAVFADGPDEFGLIVPIEINFEQISANAVPYIIITSENVTNASGVDWGAFRFIIEDGTTGTPPDVHFDVPSTFEGAEPFNISPFTSYVTGGITSQVQLIEVFGGVVADGTTWFPGVGSGNGALYIAAAPSEQGTQRFVFKEQPLPIPLPAAAWTGLVGLIGLALPRAARRVRETLAV